MKTCTLAPIVNGNVDSANSIDVSMLKFPQPIVRRKISWTEVAKGNLKPSDRGVEQDIYGSDFTLYFATREDLQEFKEWFEEHGKTSVIAVTDIAANEYIFAPNIDHTEDISVTFFSIDQEKEYAFGGVNKDAYVMDASFRIKDASLVFGVSADLSAVNLENDFSSGSTDGVSRSYSADGEVTINDRGSSEGVFKGSTINDLTSVRKLLQAVMATVRGDAFNLTTVMSDMLPGVDHPFGPSNEGDIYARILEYTIARVEHDRWKSSFTLVREKE